MWRWNWEAKFTPILFDSKAGVLKLKKWLFCLFPGVFSSSARHQPFIPYSILSRHVLVRCKFDPSKPLSSNFHSVRGLEKTILSTTLPWNMRWSFPLFIAIVFLIIVFLIIRQYTTLQTISQGNYSRSLFTEIKGCLTASRKYNPISGNSDFIYKFHQKHSLDFYILSLLCQISKAKSCQVSCRSKKGFKFLKE